MALVTVQRSPSPSNSPEVQLGSDFPDGESGQKSPHKSQRVPSGALKRFHRLYNTIRFVNQLRFSETYLAVKGAACILPQSECLRTITRGSHGGDMQSHLQSMYYLLRNQDTIKVAVKVESGYPSHNRYLVVVSTIDRQDTEESVILGVDIVDDQTTIGLVLTVWGDMTIRLDGDGGFSLASNERHHIFKPVSVQAMWSALQSLIRVRNIAQRNNYYPKGLTHTWVTYYEVRIKSDQSCLNEWNTMEDIESHRTETPITAGSMEKAQVEKTIKGKLKAIMMAVDLEEVTSFYLRSRLEDTMEMSLAEYKPFIDEEMIVIMRQMDAASEIFDYLYLGSEWNASNLEDLQEQGIGNILNMAREIDNFFPGVIEYYNVRVYDVEQAELLRHWDNTFKFISRAKQQRQKVLVHCKMGVSRSACTVMAYAMKEYGWTLEQAYQFVKQKRSCIKPNAGFMKQLIIYQGILDASKQRHNKLWRSVSVGNLNEMTRCRTDSEESSEDEKQNEEFLDLSRPRSWTPHNCEMNCRKARRRTDKDDNSSNDGRQVTGVYNVNSPVAERSGTCGASSTTGEVALFTLDEDSTTNDHNSPQKQCGNTSNNQPAVDTGEWCVAPHGTVSSVRKVEEWMAKTPLEGIVKSAAPVDCVGVDSSMESHTLSCANLHPEKAKVYCGTEEGCVESAGPAQMMHSSSSSALLTSKVRPDNSWIKEALQAPPDVATAEEDAPNSMTEDKPEVVDIVDVTTTNEKSAAMSDNCNSSVKSDCTGESKEIGVVEHYEKELIPWNTGTVRRQTQDLEERLKTGLKLCSDASSPASSVGSPVSAHNDFSSITASNPQSADLGGSCGDDPLLMSPERSSTSNDMQLKRPVSSVYANEDIPLEPGIVMRTKQEIEERTKKSSDGDESHPVQRSSSCKVSEAERSHKRRSRNSDRRKTCQPVLQSSYVVDSSAPVATSSAVFASQPQRSLAGEERSKGTGSETEEKCEVKVYQIGSEQVEMQKDKVKRRTKDFEELSKEEQDERTSSILVPATQELMRSHSPFPSNEEVEIRTGSVLEQKLTIEMKYGTGNNGNEFAQHTAKTKHLADVANTTIDSQNNIDVDIPTFDANLNIEITSELNPCGSCSSHRQVDDRLLGGALEEKASTELGKRLHSDSDHADGQNSADNSDKCGDVECKYCSRVLDAYYKVGGGKMQECIAGTTEASSPKLSGLVGQTFSGGDEEFFSGTQRHWPSESVDSDSTATPKPTRKSDCDSALFYSSNYNLPGMPRRTAVSHPSWGSYPTQDACGSGVGISCEDNGFDIHSLQDKSLIQKPSNAPTSQQRADVTRVPVMVYEEEAITSCVRTTWQQQEALGNNQVVNAGEDAVGTLSPSPQHKMDTLTLTLIRDVASAFQCSPVRSRGIVRRLAKDIESRTNPQSFVPFCPDIAPALPKSMPPGFCPEIAPDLPESMPPVICSNTESSAPHEPYTPCSKSSAVLASDESLAVSSCASVDVAGGAPSQSFTSSRELQLNMEQTPSEESTETSECKFQLETSSHESSPADDSRVRNLVEIFEPKDGTSSPGGAASGTQASIVKRLTWHAGDRTKPKFDVAQKNIASFSSVESPPGRRRTLSDMSVVPNVSDQPWRHTPYNGDNAGDSKFVTKLVELCTVPEGIPTQQQKNLAEKLVCSTPPGDSQSCHVTSPSRPWEHRIPMSSHREPDPSQVPRKTRKLQGKSHPLSKLSGETSQLGRSVNSFYNTM